MCSPETEQKLCKLLLILAEGERSIEISRQVLSDLKEFDSFQIFKNIDIEDKNKIDCYSIINFLRIKGIYCTEEEASLIILFYDQDYDNVLSYPEFINVIQSEKSLKNNLNKPPKDKIPFDVDYSLGKLLEKEVELSRKFIYALKDIKCRYDFNIHNLYHKIKYFNSITNESLRVFFQKNEVSFLESDIKLILKRLDLNKDGIIDLCEFHALLGFPDCIYCCPCLSCNSCGKCLCESCYNNIPCYSHGTIQNKKNNKNDFDEKYNYNYYSMGNILNENIILPHQLESSRNLNSINKYETSFDNNNKEIERKNISKGLTIRTSPRRNYNPIEINLNKNDNLNLNIKEKNQFNDFLKLLMIAESKIEEAKIELAKKEDFSCADAFKIFVKDNNDYITKDDLKYGLFLLDLNVDDFIINLLFKRFDLNKKDELSYADFFDMLIPFEKIYRDNIEQKTQKSFSCEQSLNLISNETKEIIKNVFNIIINYEVEINEKRKDLSILKRKLKDIFYLFDKKDIGFFGFEEFKKYIEENKLINDKNLNGDLLFIRFDKNRNG
jgi:Ca2+-binding EF-hand superfamily protein